MTYKLKIGDQWFEFHDEELGRAAGLAAELDATMVNLLPNPTGAGYFNATTYGGPGDISVPILSTVSGNTPLGTLMEVVSPYTGPGTAAKAVPANVQPSSTTADNLLIGVCVGGGNQDSATAGVPPGQTALIKSFGLAQILCDATTTAGNALIQSAATAGAAKNGTAVTNQTVGTALQAVTIASGVKLVWALLKMT
jgi:hypothetical protein